MTHNEQGGKSGYPDIHNGTDVERINELVRLLDVQPVGESSYAGMRKLGGVGRVFGGQVVAQALVAASKSVSRDRMAHSLHAYFLRGGSEDHGVEFQVDCDFDGGSFSNRRVVARQNGDVILNLAASFQRAEQGHHHQIQMPEVPAPDDLPTVRDFIASQRGNLKMNENVLRIYTRQSPMEMRPVGIRQAQDGSQMLRFNSFWVRASAPFSADQWMHRAFLAYVSDLGLLGSAIGVHSIGKLQAASLDHSLWFHRDVNANDWLLYHMESPWAGAGRGLGFGSVFDQKGNLVATAAQEGLMRDREFRAS